VTARRIRFGIFESSIANKLFTPLRRAADKFPVCYTQFPREPFPVNKLRISVVQYLNTAPLVRGFTHGPLQGKYDLSFTVPSQCAEALRTGAADVAIIPAIEYQRIPELVILPDLSIASKERARSLLIVAKAPIREARRIGLDRSSRSTQALTKILCDARWLISPEFFECDPDLATMLAHSDAALLIGDPALRLVIAAEQHASPGRDGAWVSTGAQIGLPQIPRVYLYDVVHEWWQLTERPAVLAVWAARPEIATPELVTDFSASLAFGLAHLPEICAEAARELQLPEKELSLYLRTNIDYSLDAENQKGLIQYYAHAARLGLVPQLNPISIAGSSTAPAHVQGFVSAKRSA
jgi:chorismate dehydratase